MFQALHRALFGLTLFLAVTAITGGLGLVTAAIAPGTDLIAGSIFPSYLIPGLALLLLVGGGATLATIEVARHGPYQHDLSVFAGAMIVTYELVEWVFIGYHYLQAIFLGAGGLIILLAMWLIMASPVGASQPVTGNPDAAHRPHG